MRPSSANDAHCGAWSGSDCSSRDDQVLDQQLPQQTAAAGPDREADTHLAPARQRPCQHHRGHVRAGDDEQQRHRSAERGDDGVVIADEMLAQAAHQW
jgi:hypothetical protein